MKENEGLAPPQAVHSSDINADCPPEDEDRRQRFLTAKPFPPPQDRSLRRASGETTNSRETPVLGVGRDFFWVGSLLNNFFFNFRNY